jgi:hypothetical protein
MLIGLGAQTQGVLRLDIVFFLVIIWLLGLPKDSRLFLDQVLKPNIGRSQMPSLKPVGSVSYLENSGVH